MEDLLVDCAHAGPEYSRVGTGLQRGREHGAAVYGLAMVAPAAAACGGGCGGRRRRRRLLVSVSADPTLHVWCTRTLACLLVVAVPAAGGGGTLVFCLAAAGGQLYGGTWWGAAAAGAAGACEVRAWDVDALCAAVCGPPGDGDGVDCVESESGIRIAGAGPGRADGRVRGPGGTENRFWAVCGGAGIKSGY